MPVTAKLSRGFYEKLGDELANELVEWFNLVDATYRTDLRELNELNFARFDAKVEQRFAQSDAKWEQRFTQVEAEWERRFGQLKAKVVRRLPPGKRICRTTGCRAAPGDPRRSA